MNAGEFFRSVPEGSFVQCGSLFSFMSFGTVNVGGGTLRPKNATLWRFLHGLSIPFGSLQRKITDTLLGVGDFLVDPKGIEPSNLTDANRALSQLSYEPIAEFILTQIPSVVKRLLKFFNIRAGSARNERVRALPHLSTTDRAYLPRFHRRCAAPRDSHRYPLS